MFLDAIVSPPKEMCEDSSKPQVSLNPYGNNRELQENAP